VWGLDPNWDGGDPSSCGCGGCASCRNHAANKWFASAAAADAGRAHPFCKCAVVPLVQIRPDVYDALFVSGGARASVDLRYQWVQAVLAQSPDTPDSVFSDATKVVRAGVRPAPVLQSVSGKRVLYIDVHTDQLVTATITLSRDGTTLAHKAVRGVRGDRRLRLEIPSHARSGPARLRLRLRNSSGHSKVVTRTIQIPRALQPSSPR
jgi:hypothetical protein